jgi:hypothetical protein
MSSSELDIIDGVFDAEIVDTASGELDVVDSAAAAVLDAMEAAADDHLDAIRPHKTKVSYANDWALWTEFHAWLAERTDTTLPLTIYCARLVTVHVLCVRDRDGMAGALHSSRPSLAGFATAVFARAA